MAAVKVAYPRVTLIVAVTDQGLTTHFFIIPELGDFGDRYFGSE